MLGVAKPKIYAFLSATPATDRCAVIMNLAAAIQRLGSNVLVMDEYVGPTSVSAMMGVAQNRTILDGVRLGKNIEDGVRYVGEGFGVATLLRSRDSCETLTPSDREKLDDAVRVLMKKHDVMLMSAELDEHDGLPLRTMVEANIVVQMSPKAESIKSSYALIKRLGGLLGRRPFSLLLTQSSGDEGEKVFENLSRVASRHLAIAVDSLGNIPADESVARAAKMRRSVVNAFPMASSAAAYRAVAQRFCHAAA
jgi:flagellar biosynthesis protein FlhG